MLASLFHTQRQEAEHWSVDECRFDSGISAGATSWSDCVGAPRQLSFPRPFGKSLVLLMRPARVVSQTTRNLFCVHGIAASGRSMQCC